LEEGIEVVVGDDRQLQQQQQPFNGTVNNSLSQLVEYYYMKRCPCDRGDRQLFCPLDAPLCYVPRHITTKGWCERSKRRVRFLRSAWPAVWGWCFLVLAGMLTSKYGRFGIHYVISCCLPYYWNRQRVHFLILHHPNEANRLLRFYHRRNREQNLGLPTVLPVNFDPTPLIDRMYASATDEQDENEAKPTSLALRTRVYRKDDDPKKKSPKTGILPKAINAAAGRGGGGSDENQIVDGSDDPFDDRVDGDDDDEDLSCTICFVPLEDGDRVGALSCNHLFHVDCLKSWLQRRNCCPLCQKSCVAIPRYERTTLSSPDNNSTQEREGGGEQEQETPPTE